MTWRVVSASAVGTSHRDQGRGCEDDCWATAEHVASGPFLALFVADGAGSASHGKDGAQLSVEAAATFVHGLDAETLARPDTALARQCFAAIRHRVLVEAGARGLQPRDMAATLIGVIGSKTATVVVQIGDGAVVLDIGEGLVVPVPPMTGEYANVTCFLTDDDAMERVQTVAYDSAVLRAAAFTDGLQALALHLASSTPHAPFFDPLFATLSATPDEREDELQAALLAYLSSDRINERTDDDKTLVLAVAVD